MTVIDHFQSAIPEAVGDGYILQQWLLQYLFPHNFSIKECCLLLHDLNVPESYKTVAARGFAAALGQDHNFRAGIETLARIEHPRGLADNLSALMGLALGLRNSPSPEIIQWWKRQIHDLATTPEEEQLQLFLECLRDPANAPQPTDALLRIASSILRPDPSWDKDLLAAFLLTQRKRPFPYEDDFLRNMLTIAIEDFAIRQLLLGPEDHAAFKAQQVAAIQDAIARWADKRARLLVTAAALATTLGSIAATTLLFVLWPQSGDLRGGWDILKWATLWLGGPLAAGGILFREAATLLRGKPWNMDLTSLTQKTSLLLRRRLHKRLRLPITS